MSHTSHNHSLSNSVRLHAKVDSAQCYQCGKCSAGCPLSSDMDYTSSRVMRMLQVEDAQTDKEVLQSQSIWLCASCEMCISRCPMSIDIPKVMDYLRQESVKQGLHKKHASNRNIVSFHRSFLDMVRLNGRTYEIGMVADYKIRSKKLLQDIMLAPKMLLKGKLPIIPESVKNKKEIRNIFNRSKK